MTPSTNSCTVAAPRVRNHATFNKTDATRPTTRAQPTRLKALASAVLIRNQARNQDATEAEKVMQLSVKKDPVQLHGCVEDLATKPEPPVRQWHPCYPYTCKCGEPTGFSTNGIGLCPSCEFGPHDPLEPPVDKTKKKQVSCRAFPFTGIHAVSRAELCRDRQGDHCGDCELRQGGKATPAPLPP